MSQLHSDDGSCDKYWELISAVADGEATREEEADLRAHMASCRECSDAFAFVEAASRASRQIPRVAPPPTLRGAIFAATTRRPSVLANLREAVARYRLAVGVTAAAAAAAVFFLYLKHTPGPVPGGTMIAHVDKPHTIVQPVQPTKDRVPPKVSPSTPVVAFSSIRGAEPATMPAPVASVRPIPTGTRVAKALSIRPSFIGSRVMVGVPPFDPRESSTGYKPVARDVDEPAVTGGTGEPEPAVGGEGPKVADAKPGENVQPAGGAKDTKVALLTDDTKTRIKAAFDREKLQQEMEFALKRSRDSGAFTLVKSKF